MPRIVHVAVVRVYRSLSGYGAPFTVPAGSPKIVTIGGEVLEIHLGGVPAWLKRAEARVRINGEAMLRGLFQNDLVGREQLNASLSQAKDHVFVDEKQKWLIAVVLRWQVEWSDTDINNDEPWLWLNAEEFIETKKSAEERIASLDLAARVLKHYVPNGVDEVVVADRTYVGRDDSFGDAFGMPHFMVGAAGSAQSQLDEIEAALAGPEMQAALANAITAPAVPKDSGRPDRFKTALHSDLLADEGGSYGRYELLREMQPMLMRTSSMSPLAVMFVDMNGLKQINDSQGHRAGDEAIAEFRMAVREAHQGALFRTGGDEFVLFRLGAPGDASTVARKILSAVAARQVGGAQLSASVGVVLAIDPFEKPDAIVERADHEMYRAKRTSRLYTPRPCVLAIEGTDVEMVTPPGAMTATCT